MFWTQHRRRENVVDVLEELDPPTEPNPGPTPGLTPGLTPGPNGAPPARRGTPTGSPEFVARLKAVLDG